MHQLMDDATIVWIRKSQAAAQPVVDANTNIPTLHHHVFNPVPQLPHGALWIIGCKQLLSQRRYSIDTFEKTLPHRRSNKLVLHTWANPLLRSGLGLRQAADSLSSLLQLTYMLNQTVYRRGRHVNDSSCGL